MKTLGAFPNLIFSHSLSKSINCLSVHFHITTELLKARKKREKHKGGGGGGKVKKERKLEKTEKKNKSKENGWRQKKGRSAISIILLPFWCFKIIEGLFNIFFAAWCIHKNTVTILIYRQLMQIRCLSKSRLYTHFNIKFYTLLLDSWFPSDILAIWYIYTCIYACTHKQWNFISQPQKMF